MTDTKILEKLAKLHAHQQSAKEIGSEEEAQAFAEKIQELLLRHRLSMTDIEFARHEKEEPVGKFLIDYAKLGYEVKRRRVAWQEQLAGIVARAHLCRILVHPGTNLVTFVGRESDVKVAEYAFVTLSRLAEKIADKAYVKYFYKMRDLGDERMARGYRQAFLTGFVTRLDQRYRDLRNRTNGQESTSTALIRLNRTELAVQEYLLKMDAEPASSLRRPDFLHKKGFYDGREAADKLDLENRAIDRDGKSNKQLKG